MIRIKGVLEFVNLTTRLTQLLKNSDRMAREAYFKRSPRGHKVSLMIKIFTCSPLAHLQRVFMLCVFLRSGKVIVHVR